MFGLGNLNINLTGYAAQVVDQMIQVGYAKTKTEALRLALFDFGQRHGLVLDDEAAYAVLAKKILADVESGKEKVKPFSLKELD